MLQAGGVVYRARERKTIGLFFRMSKFVGGNGGGCGSSIERATQCGRRSVSYSS